MNNIQETSDGWKVIGLDGDELDNSPYETEKKAKQALNAHKMGKSKRTENNDSKEIEGKDKDNKEELDEKLDSGDSTSDKNENETSSIMSILSNKYVILGAGGLLAYKFLTSDGSQSDSSENVDQVIDEDDEPETMESDSSDDKNLDSGRVSAMDLIEGNA